LYKFNAQLFTKLQAMNKISRRKMMQLSGLTAAGSLAGLSSLSAHTEINKSIGQRLKIIVAGAHPDDPESGCGGAMAIYAAQGHEVVAAYLTRGEGGIEGKSHDEAAKIRTKEAINACNILGARPEFLGQIDGSCEITKNRYTEVQTFFERENPDIVFTHWPIDTHRDHRICSILVYDAWLSLGKKYALYYFEVESGIQTQNFAPSSFLDIGSVIKIKTEACKAHISQIPEDFYENVHRKMERFRGLQFNCEYAEAFIAHHQNPTALLSR
jgi:LmbE family N-acetylglucosaminyl deacetylase